MAPTEVKGYDRLIRRRQAARVSSTLTMSRTAATSLTFR